MIAQTFEEFPEEGHSGESLAAVLFGDRLFNACHIVARKIGATRSGTRFVFVSGPYYAPSPDAQAVVGF